MKKKRPFDISNLPSMNMSRRDFLCRSYNGIGALALAGVLAEELSGEKKLDPSKLPLPQLKRKAKH